MALSEHEEWLADEQARKDAKKKRKTPGTKSADESSPRRGDEPAQYDPLLM